MTELSPAAQAVWTAWQKAPISLDLVQTDRDALAAAFRAVVDQLAQDGELEFYNGRVIDVDDLLAIAAELENL